MSVRQGSLRRSRCRGERHARSLAARARRGTAVRRSTAARPRIEPGTARLPTGERIEVELPVRSSTTWTCRPAKRAGRGSPRGSWLAAGRRRNPAGRAAIRAGLATDEDDPFAVRQKLRARDRDAVLREGLRLARTGGKARARTEAGGRSPAPTRRRARGPARALAQPQRGRAVGLPEVDRVARAASLAGFGEEETSRRSEMRRRSE